MKQVRWWFLERHPHARLTHAEMRQGWHFCSEFDFGLTQGEQLDEQRRCAWCGFDRRRVPRWRGSLEVVQRRLLRLLDLRAMQLEVQSMDEGMAELDELRSRGVLPPRA